MEVAQPWLDCQQGPEVLEEPTRNRVHTGVVQASRQEATVFLHSLSAPKGVTRLLQEALKKPWNNQSRHHGFPFDLRGGSQWVLGLVPAPSPGLTTQSLSKHSTLKESSPVHPVPGLKGKE